jgi:hypothetical protein
MRTAWPAAMDQPTQKRVSKACDACKRRKVRCNGQTRCQQCAHLGLRCIYSPSGKQRSQGKRGHIISEFRNQTNAPIISPSILPAHTGQIGFQASYSPISPIFERNECDASMSPSTHLIESEGLLLTRSSISSILVHVAIQQGILPRSHTRLCGGCLPCSSSHRRT